MSRSGGSRRMLGLTGLAAEVVGVAAAVARGWDPGYRVMAGLAVLMLVLLGMIGTP